MCWLTRRHPKWSKRLLRAAIASLIVPIATSAIEAQVPGATPLRPPVDPEARFEVVSIKPFDASGGVQPRMTTTPGRYDVIGMPLRLVVGQGLRVTLDRIVGWPDWIDAARYTISAKMPDGPPLPATAIFAMVENLLKDRFNLVTRRETRELPVYNLVLARPDRRPEAAVKESPAQCVAELTQRFDAVRRGAPAPTTPTECIGVQLGLGTVSMKGTAMVSLANFLTQSVGRPVIDKTGLTSFYDLVLKWTPDGGNPAPFGLPAGVMPQAPLPPADPDAPNIFTAVQEQLGLKLEAARGPVEVVVIDRLEKPTLD